MKKEDIIKSILDESRIRHNIRIDFHKSRSAIDKANLSDEQLEHFNEDMQIEGRLLEDFCHEFMYEEMNDSGNRNLCSCKKYVFTENEFNKDNGYNGRAYSDEMKRWYSKSEAKKAGLIGKVSRGFLTDKLGFPICKKHDLWHVYQAGKSGATLYWDKYWNETNSGFYFKLDEEDLKEKENWELETILKEIRSFNEKVVSLMKTYYIVLEDEACEYKKRLKEEAKQQKYNEMIAPYEVNLFELSKNTDERIKRIAISLIKLLKIK